MISSYFTHLQSEGTGVTTVEHRLTCSIPAKEWKMNNISYQRRRKHGCIGAGAPIYIKVSSITYISYTIPIILSFKLE